MPNKPTKPNLRRLALSLLLPLMLLQGCASLSPPSAPVVVAPPAIPPLPASARQPIDLEQSLAKQLPNMRRWQKLLDEGN